MNKKYIKILLCLFLAFTATLGVAFTMKADIGIGAFDALGMTVAHITGIKVGTVSLCYNLILVGIQYLLLKKRFTLTHAMQIPFNFVLGFSVNFFFYDVLKNFTITSYPMRVFFLILGYVIVSGTIGAIISLDLVAFSLEGACLAVAEKTGIDFSKIRQGCDIAFIAISLAVAFICRFSPYIREGTVLGMIITGPMMGFCIKNAKKTFIKLGLLDPED